MKFIFFAAVLFITGVVHAACQTLRKDYENVSVQAGAFNDGSCYITAHKFDSFDMIYRDYIFTQAGQLMVFNSFSDSPDEFSATGARDFYFPSLNPLDIRVEFINKNVYITMSNGQKVTMSGASADITSITGSKIKLSNTIVPSKKGGLEILKNTKFFIDSDFKMGSSPSADPKGNSKIIDHLNNSCAVINREIFEYVDEDPVYRYQGAAFNDFLHERCPNLKLDL